MILRNNMYRYIHKHFKLFLEIYLSPLTGIHIRGAYLL